MNLFDLLLKKKTDTPVEFAPLVADLLANSAGVRADGTLAHSDLLPMVKFNEDGTTTVSDWQDKPQNTTTQTIPQTTPTATKISFGQKLSNALFGQQATPTDNINIDNSLLNANSDGEAPISSTISENPRTGGIFRDIASGYNENRNNAISLDNFGQKTTPDGRNKGFAYRLGEGLGSIARFGESPLGRGLIVGGLVGATGGDALPMLAYGTSTSMQNQANRMNDKLYRNELKQTYKQSIMNDPRYNTLTTAEDKQIQDIIKQSPEYLGAKTEKEKAQVVEQMYNALANDKIASKQNEAIEQTYNNIDSLRGYLRQDAYGALAQSQQLRDNAAYRKMFYDAQQANLREQMELRKQQAKANEEQQKFNRWYQTANLDEKRAERADRRAYNNAQLGLGYARLNNDNYNKELDRDAKNQKEFEKANKGSIDILNQIGTIRRMLKQNPDAVGLWKGNTPGWLINRMDPKGVELRTAIDDLRTYIRHELTGAQFSPAEAREYERFLPTTKDTPSIINAKLNALEKKLNAKIYGQNNTKKGGLAF